MSTEQHETWPAPFAWLYDIDENGNTAPPAVYPAPGQEGMADRTGAPDLVTVSGPFAHAQARAGAVRIAANQKQGTLRVAMFEMTAEPEAALETHLAELHAAFDGVVPVTGGQPGHVAAALVRTLMWPGPQEQWIGCDWNGVRHIFQAARGFPVRYGSGRGAGEGRAAAAIRDALAQAGRDGSDLHTARGVCAGVRCDMHTLYGRELREVLRQIRDHISPDATITLSTGSDGTLLEGTLEVDIFVCGGSGVAAAAPDPAGTCAAGSTAASAGAGCSGGAACDDPLYAQARSLVLRHGRALVSLVQRHLRIGYVRALRLLDAMQGDIPAAGDGARQP